MTSKTRSGQTWRATKILATLGSASESEEQITQLFEAGVNIFRLNFSHGTHDEHQKRIEIIRAIEKKLSKPIGILADMQGPKYRIGRVVDGLSLVEGSLIQFDQSKEIGNEKRLPLPHPEIFKLVNWLTPAKEASSPSRNHGIAGTIDK